MVTNKQGKGQAGQPSPELRCLIESLITRANLEDYMLIGFLGDAGTDNSIVTFSNIRERGSDLADVFHAVGELIAQKSLQKLIYEQPITRPN